MSVSPAAGQQPSPLLELRGVTIAYASTKGTARPPAADNVSFTLGPAEGIGIVGESGSGKSSLARAIVGLVRPTRGTIHLGQQDITALWRRRFGRDQMPVGPQLWRKAVQMVFQDPAGSLDPRLSVAQCIAEPLLTFGLADAAQSLQQVDALLGEVGLDPALATRLPSSLSGGQKQRVALARALACGPQVVVADEPTSALDVTAKQQILRLFWALMRSRQLGLVLVSHDLAAVAAICSRVIVMQAGQVVEAGNTQDVLKKPVHAYTRSLLDAVVHLPRAQVC